MKAFSYLAAGLMCMAVASQAHEGTPTAKQVTPGMKMDAKPAVLKGEIVDLGCYLGREAKGADHKSCALKCIAGGMPMGLLTADGTLYLLTMSHESADPYNKAKEMASMNVEVTGKTMERNGLHAIEVAAITEVPSVTKKSGY